MSTSVTPVIATLSGETIVSGTVTINAGQPLFVNSDSSTFSGDTTPAGTDLTASKIQWDFGDYSNPATKTANPNAYDNVTPGFNSAHVYDTPSPSGQPYDLTLQITPPGSSQPTTAHLNVVVVANTRYTSANTIWVRPATATSFSFTDPTLGAVTIPAGSSTGSGSLTSPATWPRMQTLLSSGSFGSDTTVRFWRGDTNYATADGTSTGAFQGVTVGSFSNIEFTDDGYDPSITHRPTTKPIINMTQALGHTGSTGDEVLFSINGTSNKDIAVRNLEIDGHLQSNGTPNAGLAIKTDGNRVLVDNMSFKDIFISTQDPDPSATGLLVQRCDTGFEVIGGKTLPGRTGEYFLYYSGSSDVVALGNQVGDVLYNNHNTRVFASNTLMYGNTFRNVVSDATAGSTDDDTMRVNLGNYIDLADNTTYGGQVYVGYFGSQSGYTTMNHVVIEGNRILRDSAEASGNNIQRIFTDHDPATGNSQSDLVIRNNYIEGSDNGPVINPDAHDSRIVNNTLKVGIAGEGILITPISTNLDLRNNLTVLTAGSPSGLKAVETFGTAPISNIAHATNNVWPTTMIFRFNTANNSLATWNSTVPPTSPTAPEVEDKAADVTLDSSFRPTDETKVAIGFPLQSPSGATSSTVVNYVHDDLNGTARLNTALNDDGTSNGGAEDFWTAGAVSDAPSNLVVTTNTASSVGISWADNSTGENGFWIERRTGSSGTWTRLNSSLVTGTTYTDSTVAASTTYAYRVIVNVTSAFSGIGTINEGSASLLPVTTPAAPNLSIIAATYLIDGNSTSSNQMAIAVQFSGDASAFLSSGDLTLTDLDPTMTTPLGIVYDGYDSGTNTATYSFSYSTWAHGLIPNGDYKAVFSNTHIDDANGSLPGDTMVNFFFVDADADHNRRVDSSDQAILTANFGMTGATFSEGDFNYDGVVNLLDLNALSVYFGTVQQLNLDGEEIGTTQSGASTSVVTAASDYDVTGVGTDVFGTSDQFEFGYAKMSGDFDVKVRLDSISGYTTTGTAAPLAGIMARNSLDDDSENVFLRTFATPGGTTKLGYRSTVGGTTDTLAGTGSNDLPSTDTWLRLVRSGNTFTAYYGTDGSTWTSMGSETVALNSEIYLGLGVCSKNTGATTTADFRGLTLA
jgi:hypothetical protein